jgi:hypothetical protein
MGKYLTAEDFLKGIVGAEEDVEIPGVGTVRVRAPGKMDAMRASLTATDDVDRVIKMLAISIVEPPLTEEQARALYQATADKIDPVLDRLFALAPRPDDDIEKKVGDGS